jgi:hypothetical protein
MPRCRPSRTTRMRVWWATEFTWERMRAAQAAICPGGLADDRLRAAQSFGGRDQLGKLVGFFLAFAGIECKISQWMVGREEFAPEAYTGLPSSDRFSPHLFMQASITP